MWQVANPAENIKIDPGLYEACRNMVESGPCQNVEPGHGRLVECLSRQLNSPKMKEECQERLVVFREYF